MIRKWTSAGRRDAVVGGTGMLDRRRFFALTAAGLLSACHSPLAAFGRNGTRGRPFATRGATQRVVVVGAGISGLAAARTLADAGHDVVVVESRSRIGGRINTSSQWADAPVDLGASWIHGIRGNPIAKIAGAIGAQTVSTDDEASEVWGADGKILSRIEQNRLFQLENQIEQVVAQGQKAAVDQPFRTTVEDGIGYGQLGAQDRRFVDFIVSDIEQDQAGSASSLSTYWFDDPDFFGGSDVVFPGGYRAITDHLASGLDIELSRRVTQITVNGGGVTVATPNGTYSGDRAVVTLPLGVLRSGAVQFDPGLPVAMQTAINSLRMGVLNKVFLRFPSIFWPNELDWIEQVPAETGQWQTWLNVGRVVGQPILMAFNAADFGQTLEGWSDPDIIASGMDRLRGIFGTSIPNPVGAQITRWASDPHTLGSYSYIPAGADPSMRAALAGNLEERVFFAGEATNRAYYPTVHGAYLSGLRAAAEAVEDVPLFADGFESGDFTRWSSTQPGG